VSVGERNNELIGRNTGDLLTRKEFYSDGSRLLSAVLSTHRADDGTQGAGGNLIEGWLADSRFVHGAGATVWVENNMGFSNYAATTNGGPYATFDGAEYLSIVDSPWQEAAAEEIFTWRWCNSTDLGSNGPIIAKYNTGLNNRSWLLHYDNATNRFTWITNNGGAAVNDVSVAANTFGAPAINTWYFVAGYFQASTLMRIWVGRAADDTLTLDSLAVGVPAGVFNGNADLTVGADGTPAQYWKGNIGVGHTRFNVPAASINAYAIRLFHLTRWFYQA
jgi:hypothetical protein